MKEFKRGDLVRIRDYPFGRPINAYGKVVGVLPDDHYNVMMMAGAMEGRILKYKYWKLLRAEKER